MSQSPFDTTGVVRESDGIKRYTDRPQSLVSMLRASVERFGGNEAVVDLDAGERLTYAELWRRCARVAAGLQAEGLAPGDRAAIRLPNGLDWVLAFWGCQLAGVAAVPINTRFSEDEVRYVIEDSGTSYVLEAGAPLPDGEPTVYQDPQPEDMAAIFYTSGTTGFPKGAITTHANFLSNTESGRRVIGLPDDGSLRNLVAVPLFHATGCHSQLVITLELGGCVVIMSAFGGQAFLRAIQDERINILAAVPAMYWLAINQDNFTDYDVTSIHWLLYGGAPIAPDLVQAIKGAFPNARVGNGFGLTETSSIATFLPHEYADDHADSVGFPSPVIDVDLHEPNPHTGVGELMIRGSNVVPGYWNKPDATRKTFAKGWLYSGDLARIDDQGLVYIVDRAKDMINRGGENVYCVEVENCLAGHPSIFEAAVVGVPDEVLGEKVGAVLVARPGHDMDPHEVIDFCRSRIGDFKVPQYIHVTSEPLPRNPGGKVVKPQLRESVEWGQQLF